MKKYEKNSKKVRDLMENIEKYLISQYGEVKEEWQPMLNLLADDYDMYNNCMKELKKVGIFDQHLWRANPLMSIAKDYKNSIYKITNHLGISPLANQKMKVQEAEGDDFFNKMNEDED